jgi:5-methyltetrahydrofolate--homocysteine methyltransferase
VDKEILVMSGAMGTMLHKEGANLGGCIAQWIVEHPQTYEELVREYFQVGCHIVAAATSTLNRISLAKFGLAEKIEELNRGVIQIIKAIQPDQGFVAGNIGPTGKLLKPMGEVSVDELLDAYGQQAQILAESGAEIINILTMYDLEEAVAALRAAKTRTSLPVIVSLAFNPAAKGYRTMMGVSPEVAAQRLQAEGADVIGANCGSLGLDQMTEVLQLMKTHCGKPLIAKPNAGSPQLVDGRETYPAGPELFAEHVGEWIEKRVRIVSGCCGTTPLHLKRVGDKVKELSQG